MAKVHTLETFRYEMARPGDLVDREVVDEAVNALPPATLTGTLVQMGEPYSHLPDHTGRWRATFATFQKVCEGVWEFRGYCFRGETKEPIAIPLEAL